MSDTKLAKKDSFSTALTTSLAEIENGLPKGFNISRFVNNAVALLNDNDNLSKFAKENGTTQIKAGLVKGAVLGLDAMNSEFYLVPYGKKLNFMPSYKGSVKVCKKYAIRPIKDIYAKLVKEGDDFEEAVVNGEPTINFKPKAFNDGKIIGAFAVCLFQDGGMIYEVMSLADMENTRKSSKASNSPAWTSFTGEMYKKTVLHRLCKHIEVDMDSPEQYSLFNEGMEVKTVEEQVATEISENANSEEFTEIIDAEVKEVVE